MFDFQRYIRFLPRLIVSPQGHQQNLSLGTDPIDNAEPCFPHDNIVGSHLCDECMTSNELSGCHKLPSILVTDRASLFTDHRMSGLPIRARYKLFKKICEHTLKNSSSDSSLFHCSVFSFASSLSQRIFERVLPYRGTTQPSLREVFSTLVMFQLLQQKFVIRTFLCSPELSFRSVYIHVECIPKMRDQEMKLVHQDQRFSPNFFHMGAKFCFFPVI